MQADDVISLTTMEPKKFGVVLNDEEKRRLAEFVYLLSEIDQSNLANKKYDKTKPRSHQQLQ